MNVSIMEDLEQLQKQKKSGSMSSMTTLHFKGKTCRIIELTAKIDMIEKLIDNLCTCELSLEGVAVLNEVKKELNIKINEISNPKN